MRQQILWFIVVLALLHASPAIAGYNVEATTVKDWPGVAGKIAVAPASCPADFDCAWLNETINDYFNDNEHVVFVSSQDVSQAMLDAGVEQLDAEGAKKLAELLGVQSFLLVTVGNAETKQETGTVATPVYGGGFIITGSRVAQGSVDVRIISSDGKTLAKATGFGESSFRKGKGVVGKVFGRLFERLFPE